MDVENTEKNPANVLLDKEIVPGDCRDEFLFSPGITNVNNGSYGSTPRYVLQKRQSIQYEIERCPDHWFRETNWPQWMSSLTDLAAFLRVDVNHLVFVQNTTTGINSILRGGYQYGTGDGILICSLVYNAVRNTVRSVTDYHKDKDVHMYTVPITFPITDVKTDVIDKFHECLETNRNIKIAIIDHITSGTACLLPVKELIDLCDKYEVISIIDGAHAAGQIPGLDIQALSPHAYTGSLHKWCFASKGCGFLWYNAARGVDRWLRPAVTSHFYERSMQEQYFMQGTRDDTPYLSITPALNFMRACGGVSKIHAYNSALLDSACRVLVEMWGTSLLQVPDGMRAPYLRMVRLPALNGYPETQSGSVELVTALRNRHKMVAVVIYVDDVGLFVRLSAHVFNVLDDYVKLGRIIDAMRGDVGEEVRLVTGGKAAAPPTLTGGKAATDPLTGGKAATSRDAKPPTETAQRQDIYHPLFDAETSNSM